MVNSPPPSKKTIRVFTREPSRTICDFPRISLRKHGKRKRLDDKSYIYVIIYLQRRALYRSFCILARIGTGELCSLHRTLQQIMEREKDFKR